MKKTTKALTLHKTTIRNLSQGAIARMNGGLAEDPIIVREPTKLSFPGISMVAGVNCACI